MDITDFTLLFFITLIKHLFRKKDAYERDLCIIRMGSSDRNVSV